jgi:hypothetical protein
MSTVQRRFILLIGAGLAMLAFSAPVAQADVSLQVLSDETGMPCEEVVVTGQKVTGGCLVKGFSGQFTVYYKNSEGKVSIFETFHPKFDIRVNEEGKFYAINQSIWSSGWTRIPCRNKASGEAIPWAGQIRIIPDLEFGNHKYEADFSLCATTDGSYSGETVTMTGSISRPPLGALSWFQTVPHPTIKEAAWSTTQYGVELTGVES